MNKIHIPTLGIKENGNETIYMSKGEWFGPLDDFFNYKRLKSNEIVYDIHMVAAESLTEDEWYVLMDTKPLEATPEGWTLREEIFEKIWRTADEVNFYVR